MPLDLPADVHSVAVAVLSLGGAIWLGGFVTLVVVARSASAALEPAQRVAFFRHFGRRFGSVSTIALLSSLLAGSLLLIARPWDHTSTALVVIGMLLLAALAVGVVQARRMTRLRRTSLQSPADESIARRVARGSLQAVMLRASIGAISIVLYSLVLVAGGQV